MSRFTSSRAPFADRRPPKGPAQLRADWVAALSLAGQLAAEAGAGEIMPGFGFGQTLTRLAVILRDLAPDNFPLPASSARSMAAAFLKLARDFVHPSWSPQARTACAPFLGAGAGCLDLLLSDLRTEEAGRDVSRRALGERDDDR